MPTLAESDALSPDSVHLQAGRRSIGLQVFFHANYLQLINFELEDPRAMFDLIAVM